MEDDSSRADGVQQPAAWAAPDAPADQTAAWAAPGVAVDQPAPTSPGMGGGPAGGAPVDGVTADADVVSRTDGASADVPRIALRPMTVADILDGGFAIVKARPKRIIGITAAFVVPTHLLLAYLQRDLLADAGWVEFFTSDPTVQNEQVDGGDVLADWLALGLSIVVPAVALVCIAAAIGHLVGQWVMGRDAPAGEMVGVVGRRLWPLLSSFVVVKLAEAGSLLGCYLGLLFVMPLFVVVAPAIGVEGIGGMAALGRSIRLVRNRYFPVMGIALLMALVSLLLDFALAVLPQLLASANDDWWPVLTLGGIVSALVVTPFVAAATVLLYFDLRVRSEGFDLELAAGRVFDRAG